jgi:hypothetical protein
MGLSVLKGAVAVTDEDKAKLPWVRVYVTMPSDRRVRKLPVAARWAWVVCLTVARKSKMAGYLLLDEGIVMDDADLADLANITEAEAKAAMESFREMEWVVDRNDLPYIDGWERKQFESDTSTERVRRYRERKAAGQSKETLQKRSSSVSVTAPDTDNRDREQKGQDTLSPAATPVEKSKKNEYTPEFEALYAIYPRKVGKLPAFKAYKTRLKEKSLTHERAVSAVNGYARQIRKDGTDEAHTMHMATFFGANLRFEDYSGSAQVAASKRVWVDCPDCEGKGETFESGEWGTCPTCSGQMGEWKS